MDANLMKSSPESAPELKSRRRLDAPVRVSNMKVHATRGRQARYKNTWKCTPRFSKRLQTEGNMTVVTVNNTEVQIPHAQLCYSISCSQQLEVSMLFSIIHRWFSSFYKQLN